jgi:hypothetical protein
MCAPFDDEILPFNASKFVEKSRVYRCLERKR